MTPVRPLRARVAFLTGCAAVATVLALAPPAAAVTLLRVGPGGDFATVEAAISDAAGRPAEELEVAIRDGAFEAGFFYSPRTASLVISGGWNADWSARGDDPEATVLSPPVPPVSSQYYVADGAPLRLENLTLAHGLGQIRTFCNNGGTLEFAHIVVRDFASVGAPSNEQGALSLYAEEGCAGAALRDSEFRDNLVIAGPDTYHIGGAHLTVVALAPVVIERTSFLDAVQQTTDVQHPVGPPVVVSLHTTGAASTLRDLRFARNRSIAPAGASAVASALIVSTAGGSSGELLVERLVAVDNTGGGPQVSLSVYGWDLTLRDSLVAGGDGSGIYVTGETPMRLGFLTVADHPGAGLQAFLSSGEATLTSSILFDNGTPFQGNVKSAADNLFTNPGFVAPAAHDYRLMPDSPAIDAGDATPPGGIGSADVRGVPRSSGDAPDIGAYEVGPTDCEGDGGTLCLGDGRFAADVSWRTRQGERGTGNAVPLSGDSGTFWFFDPANVEMLVKTVDGCALARPAFWVFAGGVTNVETTLAVEDTATGEIRRYVNPLRTDFVPIQDTRAFTSCDAAYDPAGAVVPDPPPAYEPAGSTGCTPDATTLCLLDGRFRARASYRTKTGAEGSAGVLPLTADSGTLWFFADTNVEMLLKVIDGCGLTDHFWIFFTGLTNVEVDLEVFDTLTGEVYEHVNPLGNPFPPMLDTAALATCGGG